MEPMRMTLAGWQMKSGSRSASGSGVALLSGREHFVGVDGDVVVRGLVPPYEVCQKIERLVRRRGSRRPRQIDCQREGVNARRLRQSSTVEPRAGCRPLDARPRCATSPNAPDSPSPTWSRSS